MSQHDLDIANQGFPATRADLNLALKALGSSNSGATAPSTTYANQLWYDTANNILKIRNEDNDAWISLLTLDQSADAVTQIDVDNIRIDGNTISSTNTNGDISLSPNGTGDTTVSGRAVITGASTTTYDATTVGGQATAGTLKIQNTDNSADVFAAIDFNTNNDRVVNRIVSGHGNTTGNGFLAFVTENSGTPAERLRVDASGNVGIGTSSPAHLVDATVSSGSATARFGTTHNSGANNGTVIISNGGSGDAMLRFDYEGSNTDRARIGVTSSGQQLEFYTAGNNERMRIDSSGNLLVGKTAADFNTAGFQTASNGQTAVTRDSATPFFVNRKTDDGNIIDIRKDNTTVGSIGTNESYAYIAGTARGLRFGHSGSGAQIVPVTASGQGSDDNVDLGAASLRFDDVYATTGTIQTSDQNEKQNIASLTTAEMTAAKAISKLFKTFKWKDKVAAKGDAARTHTGVIAQEVQTAMTDAGLDASKYAFWCSDTWWEISTEVAAVEAVAEAAAVYDDDGNLVTPPVDAVPAKDAYTRIDTYNTADEAPEGATQRTRLGVRYPELLAFIGAATEQRLADIETRVAALEA